MTTRSMGLQTHVSAQQQENLTITVKGVSFTMIRVQGGTFTMGDTSEPGSDAFNAAKPAHKVTLSTYYIGETEVTQVLWKAVMGDNPSYFKGYRRPVERVSWEDCQEFIRRLNQLTGKKFRLPTEAEWEFAARGGTKSMGYKYSGSNDLEAVAWYYKNAYNESSPENGTHVVMTKKPNELGIYDMSGNVFEWCSDYYDHYTDAAQTNPQGAGSSRLSRVIRGGCWSSSAGDCRSLHRSFDSPYDRFAHTGLRLVVTLEAGAVERPVQQQQQPLQQSQSQKSLTITVKDVSFKMIWVQGGTFTMGATSEQGSDACNDEKPAHKVTLSSYYIGETEVTQELWKTVMGNNPSKFIGDKRPVDQVSWEDCQEFIFKLNQLTGKKFRLPTEAEWEFAARGGMKSAGYKYSGSDDIDVVAWYWDKVGNKSEFNPDYGTHVVKTKMPNELGIYDMSGNVWEWCSDWSGKYTDAAHTNPQGASVGSCRVGRGGSWINHARDCRSSSRGSGSSSHRYFAIGLRLVLLP